MLQRTDAYLQTVLGFNVLHYIIDIVAMQSSAYLGFEDWHNNVIMK